MKEEVVGSREAAHDVSLVVVQECLLHTAPLGMLHRVARLWSVTAYRSLPA